MELTPEIMKYIDDHRQEALDLLIELARIPAPSHHEEQRAAFCKEWLQQQGAEGVYIDDALNVIYPVGCDKDKPLAVFAAHSDVVFPDTEPLPLKIEDGRIYCPGVGDDTANVVALLMAAKYITEKKLFPQEWGLLLVVNSCEEGLGNLKGTRKLISDFGTRIREFISFDSSPHDIVMKAVGSRRYRVEVDTEGGHSFGAFGNRNAIAYLSALIGDLYQIKVPPKGKTTYNVGTISGGTSVNTIAQHAEMLYEFRSDDKESLAIMEQHFNAAIDFYRTKGIQVTVTLLGDRPCGSLAEDPGEQALIDRSAAFIRQYAGVEPGLKMGSTDCNVPLSVGIPAVCYGCAQAPGAHTREEYVEIDSLLPGLKVAFASVLYHF